MGIWHDGFMGFKEPVKFWKYAFGTPTLSELTIIDSAGASGWPGGLPPE